jgi:hypothetical protein
LVGEGFSEFVGGDLSHVLVEGEAVFLLALAHVDYEEFVGEVPVEVEEFFS